MKTNCYLKLFLIFLFSISNIYAQSMQDEVYEARNKVMPALVHIQPVIKNYRTGELEKQAVVGSGFIFHKDGFVITNYHVAGKAERIICTLHNKEQVTAKYIGGDPMTDLAVIKLDLSEYSGDIPVAKFGNSDSVMAGQYVLAMGSPLSLSRSVSAGVISTKDRYFNTEVRLPSGEQTGRYNLWIQTDAAINPGNSGGPLVNLDGQVIGVNSRATLYANNIGFAIPINVVKHVSDAILSHGKVTRSWIGLHCQALQELENYFGTNRNSGVLISSIDPSSPAENSFLKAGDVILEVNGNPVSARFVEELPIFYNLIATQPPGAELALKVLRKEQEFNFQVTTRELGELQGEIFECKGWGFTVKAITRQMQLDNSLDDSLGVYVEGVKRTGNRNKRSLLRGDIISKINNNQILNLMDFTEIYNNLTQENQDKILLTIKRSGSTRFVVITSNKNGEVDPHE
ncbi:MAG: trypsin-like peptidase domain-containing protein [candidate division Zixibacteria bacterium]|nr:trypsin-like peptidase domain-containing protein [candidate division Zixibacteria bacterium]